jgi:hypothetical protein
MIGLSSPGGGFASTMPQMAPAARVRIWREMRLMPATSTMLGKSTTSLTPTYCEVLPLARVVTMTFGNPMGNARMAAVPMAVPPPPPREMTPSILFSRASLSSSAGAPRDIASTASPRSRFATTFARSTDAGGCDLFPGDIGFQFGWFERAGVDHQDFVAALADLICDKGVLFAFGVHGAEDCDGGHGPTLARNRRRRSRKK